MSYSKYKHNSYWYNKKGLYRGNMYNGSIFTTKGEDPASEDRKNRNYAVSEIQKLINDGYALEDACKLAVEKYGDNFKYLPKSNLVEIFFGWYNGRIRERRPIEIERENEK